MNKMAADRLTATVVSAKVVMQRVVVLLLVLVLLADDAVNGFVVPQAPTVRIVVRVRKRRADHWDFWQVNSNVCPPSLCKALMPSPSGENLPAPRPRGTGGTVFYQGDVVLDKEMDNFIFPAVNHTRHKRATVRLRNRLWKDAQVPYVFAKDISGQARRVLIRAFEHISQRTCITFREKKKDDTDFVKFISEPGCWSSIGRKGGRQLLSLGRGCENIGTAVHEITHALGAWHEQAREDRDKYVNILEENISERFLKDFEKVTSEVSTSRGFPYDYQSVMHYSRYAFTRNGKPTIEVIGVGKERGLSIKQRKGLSTIDMAQLRDMYRCNLHTDTNETTCPKDWHQHETSCYQFLEHPKKQFAAASKHCAAINSHLVFIESQREDNFLARHLAKKFPYVFTWRTGGRSFNGTMKWFRQGSNPREMDYTNWAKGQPETYSSATLQRDRQTNETHWMGVWAGSVKQLPFFMYPFICERRAKRPCLKLRHKDGRDYRGKLDHTIDGYTCQKWTDQYPHQHNLTVSTSTNRNNNNNREDPDGLGNHNRCRNPSDKRRSRPWCYTTKKTREWQLCDVTTCSTGRSAGSATVTTQRPTQRPSTRESATSRRRRPSTSATSGGRRPAPPATSGGRRPSTSATSGGRRPAPPATSGGRRPSTSATSGGRRPSTSATSGGRRPAPPPAASGRSRQTSSATSGGRRTTSGSVTVVTHRRRGAHVHYIANDEPRPRDTIQGKIGMGRQDRRHLERNRKGKRNRKDNRRNAGRSRQRKSHGRKRGRGRKREGNRKGTGGRKSLGD